MNTNRHADIHIHIHVSTQTHISTKRRALIHTQFSTLTPIHLQTHTHAYERTHLYRYYSDLCWVLCLSMDVLVNTRALVLRLNELVLFSCCSCSCCCCYCSCSCSCCFPSFSCLFLLLPLHLINSPCRKINVRDRKAVWEQQNAVKLLILTIISVCLCVCLSVCVCLCLSARSPFLPCFTLFMLQDLSDWVCAFHWLYMFAPIFFFFFSHSCSNAWFSGKLSDRALGFFGSISSIIKLYKFIRVRSMSRSL